MAELANAVARQLANMCFTCGCLASLQILH